MSYIPIRKIRGFGGTGGSAGATIGTKTEQFDNEKDYTLSTGTFLPSSAGKYCVMSSYRSRVDTNDYRKVDIVKNPSGSNELIGSYYDARDDAGPAQYKTPHPITALSANGTSDEVRSIGGGDGVFTAVNADDQGGFSGYRIPSQGGGSEP
jgi:hypothetical protein